MIRGAVLWCPGRSRGQNDEEKAGSRPRLGFWPEMAYRSISRGGGGGSSRGGGGGGGSSGLRGGPPDVAAPIYRDDGVGTEDEEDVSPGAIALVEGLLRLFPTGAVVPVV